MKSLQQYLIGFIRYDLNQVSLPTVQAMLGHSTLDMTRKYVHPDMQEKIKASNAVSELMRTATKNI